MGSTNVSNYTSTTNNTTNDITLNNNIPLDALAQSISDSVHYLANAALYQNAQNQQAISTLSNQISGGVTAAAETLQTDFQNVSKFAMIFLILWLIFK